MFHWIPVSPTRHPRCRVNDELGHENDGVAPATIFFIVSGIQKANNESAVAGPPSFPNDRKIMTGLCFFLFEKKPEPRLRFFVNDGED